MYGPRVFLSMIGALVVFASATYGLTGSLGETLAKTLLCALLLQVGYFAGVLLLVWKEARARQRRLEKSTAGAVTENAAPPLPVSRLKEPEHSNF
ncbi:MAG TPA: exopolysaccharide production repressor protein [Mycoplana sp.]|jgi:exopolysaccharide production repressor protein|nr:exopolysaccharide production repressor protein [Mycoplana sp.]